MNPTRNEDPIEEAKEELTIANEGRRFPLREKMPPNWMSSRPDLEVLEEIFVQRPEGFLKKGKKNVMCWLRKSLYGL